MNRRGGLYRNHPGVDGKTWWYLHRSRLFLYLLLRLLRVSKVIFEEAVVVDTILVKTYIFFGLVRVRAILTSRL